MLNEQKIEEQCSVSDKLPFTALLGTEFPRARVSRDHVCSNAAFDTFSER
jgi:hypothetical protein